MISFEKALDFCQEAIKPCIKKELLDIEEAHGRIVAKGIYFRNESPKINSSAMDGIAINSTDAKINNILKAIGESKAEIKLLRILRKVNFFLFIQVLQYQGSIKQ